MGKHIYNNYKITKKVFEEASDILQLDLCKICFEGDINELTKTQNTQFAILTVSVAMIKIISDETGILPEFCSGHSLGEFSALTCVGVLEFSDAVRIVRYRGEIMQEVLVDGLGMMAFLCGF